MPTLGELAKKGQLHRVARFLRQELTPLDFERAPEAFEQRLEDLLQQAIELADQPTQVTTEEPSETHSTPPQQGPAETEAPKATPQPSHGTGKLFRWVSETIASDAHPDRNEDTKLVMEQASVAAVFDGVGGGPNGGAMSDLAATKLRAAVEDQQTTFSLADVLTAMNQQLVIDAKKTAELRGAGSTAAIAAITGEGANKHLAYATIGDSRVSVWHKASNQYELTVLDDQVLRLLLAPAERRPGWLKPLLTKHGLSADLKVTADEAARAATILDRDPDPAQSLTGQGTSSSTSSAVYAGQVPQSERLVKFLFDERAIVTQVLGAPTVNPHVGTLAVSTGDRILLATDGVHDNLTETELVSILAHTKFEEIASALVVRAQEIAQSGAPRAKKDDITAVVLEIL